MGSPQTGFYSTPAFELFRRGLIVDSVKKFRGINAYQTFAQLGPEWALDLLNVIIGSDGALHKFRLPQVISPNLSFASGPQTFIDFQQANGTRQVAGFFSDGTFEIFTADMTVGTKIETNALNIGLWSLVVLKNQLFGTNGQRMRKWLGTPLAANSSGWQNIGIVAPTASPTFGTGTIATLTRAANVVTAVFTTPADIGVGFGIVIAGAGDASFNGTFNIATKTDQTHYTWNQTAANLGPVSGGTYSHLNVAPTYSASAVRAASVVTFTLTASSNDTSALGPDFTASARQLQVVVTGMGDATFNATFTIVSKSGVTLTANQLGADGSTSGGTLATTFNVTGNVQVAFAYRNSVVGGVSNISPATIPAGSGAGPLAFTVVAPASADPQVDSVMWFRTLSGGGDFFLSQIETGNGGPATLVIPDSLLDQTQRGPLINNPPPQCQFFTVGQGRLFGFNVVGAPQDVIYSGYEQILVGNPPESFPPNNRLRLSIGAEQVSGGGVLQNGVVAFSQTGKMFMFRGNIQDISVTVPVVFTQFLQELPWQLGCLSNWSIQSTPYGLIWLAADKTVQFFDGSNQPQDISKPFYPILRTITAGTENQVVSAYFNWLDRDWYVLSCATGGSITNNRLFLWSLDREVGEIEMFVSDVQADYISMVTSSKLQRQLIISQKGQLYNLPASQDTRGGLVSDLTIIPPTSGQMNAFWRGGYFGNQSPERAKSFRWGRLIADQGSFLVQHRLVDDQNRTFLQPEIRGPYQVGVPGDSSKFAIGRKAKRCSVEIDFPVQDVSANVIEMQVASISTSDR